MWNKPPLAIIVFYRAFILKAMCNRKEALAIALKEEKNRLPEYSIFGEKNNLDNYDPAIAFLKNGIKPSNWEDNDLLLYIIKDYEAILSDFGV